VIDGSILAYFPFSVAFSQPVSVLRTRMFLAAKGSDGVVLIALAAVAQGILGNQTSLAGGHSADEGKASGLTISRPAHAWLLAVQGRQPEIRPARIVSSEAARGGAIQSTWKLISCKARAKIVTSEPAMRSAFPSTSNHHESQIAWQ